MRTAWYVATILAVMAMALGAAFIGMGCKGNKGLEIIAGDNDESVTTTTKTTDSHDTYGAAQTNGVER